MLNTDMQISPDTVSQAEKSIVVSVPQQQLKCYFGKVLEKTYIISTSLKGYGEIADSECTPRGLHYVHEIIGLSLPQGAVLVGRNFTGEICDLELLQRFPDRDFITTRILRLQGLEPGWNLGADRDSLSRYIYIHGTGDVNSLGKPSSHGCVRMHDADIIQLAIWAVVGTKVFIY
jgi:lipoprotein-anchoring transpeptidase ErfK/SrfK